MKKISSLSLNHWNFPFLCFFVYLFISSISPLYSQPDTLWTRTYGGWGSDAGYSIEETSDGGYIIAGYTGSFGEGFYDFYLIKTDPEGDTIWTRTYGGSGWDRGFSVQQTSDGGYIVVGATTSFGSGLYDVYLVKTDPNGDTLWTKTYGGANSDVGYSVQETTDGGYCIAGYTMSFGAGSSDVYLIKTDPNGNVLWTKTYGGTAPDFGHYVEQTSDGGYIITGETWSTGRQDVYLVKTDSNGDTLWTRIYGKPYSGHHSDVGNCVQETSDGGYIITGHTLESHQLLYLIKTDSNGDTLWTKSYNRLSVDAGYFVQQTTDGGYIITGETRPLYHPHEYLFVVKTDCNGDTLWTMAIGGTGVDVGRCVRQTSDGGYIVVGYTSSFGQGYEDVYLIKIKPDVSVKEGTQTTPTIDVRLIGIFPTIVKEKATIRLSSTSSGVIRLMIYDASGRTRRETVVRLRNPGVQDVPLSIQSLKRGVYFLSIKNKGIAGYLPFVYTGSQRE